MIVRLLSREKLTVSTAEKTLTSTYITKDVIYATIQVQKHPIRVTFDGSTTPVADTTGELWSPNSTRAVWGIELLKNISMVKDQATDAVIEVNYWGQPS